MSRYKMDDGTVVDTVNATERWEEAEDWDGHNHISRATGSQWEHQTLRCSRKGRFYLVHTSQREGARDRAEWVSNHVAAAWLLLNDRELPENLKAVEAEVSE